MNFLLETSDPVFLTLLLLSALSIGSPGRFSCCLLCCLLCCPLFWWMPDFRVRQAPHKSQKADVRTLFRNQAFRQSQRGSKKGKEGKKGKKAQSFCLFCPLCLFCFPCFIDSIIQLRKVSRQQTGFILYLYLLTCFNRRRSSS